MAFISIDQSARARLVSMRGVTVLDHPAPRDHALTALVFHYVRNFEIRNDADGMFSATFHIGPSWAANPNLMLAEGVVEEIAFAAVLTLINLTAAIPQHYAPEHDAAERAAAAEVYAAFAPMMSLAA
jgi:hypothetical protein